MTVESKVIEKDRYLQVKITNPILSDAQTICQTAKDIPLRVTIDSFNNDCFEIIAEISAVQTIEVLILENCLLDISSEAMIAFLSGINVTHFGLRHISLPGELNVSLTNLGGALAKNTNVKTLSLDNNKFGNAIVHLLDELSLNEHIEKLDLSGNNIDDGGIFKKILAVDRIKELILAYNNTGKVRRGPAKPKFSDFVQSVAQTKNLQTLNLKRNMLESEAIIQLFQQLPDTKIVDLDVSNNNLNKEIGGALNNLLHARTLLHSLNLSQNAIGNAVSNFASAIPASHLEVLDVSQTRIDWEDFCNLFLNLHDSKLKKLNISDNNFCTESEISLEQLSNQKNKLEELIVKKCKLKPEMVKKFFELFKFPELTCLDLTETKLNDSASLNSLDGFIKNHPSLAKVALEEAGSIAKVRLEEAEPIDLKALNKIILSTLKINFKISSDTEEKLKKEAFGKFVRKKRSALLTVLAYTLMLKFAQEGHILKRLPEDILMLILYFASSPEITLEDNRNIVSYAQEQKKSLEAEKEKPPQTKVKSIAGSRRYHFYNSVGNDIDKLEQQYIRQPASVDVTSTAPFSSATLPLAN